MLTSPFPALLVLSARLGRDMCKFGKSLFWLGFELLTFHTGNMLSTDSATVSGWPRWCVVTFLPSSSPSPSRQPIASVQRFHWVRWEGWMVWGQPTSASRSTLHAQACRHALERVARSVTAVLGECEQSGVHTCGWSAGSLREHGQGS